MNATRLEKEENVSGLINELLEDHFTAKDDKLSDAIIASKQPKKDPWCDEHNVPKKDCKDMLHKRPQ